MAERMLVLAPLDVLISISHSVIYVYCCNAAFSYPMLFLLAKSVNRVSKAFFQIQIFLSYSIVHWDG